MTSSESDKLADSKTVAKGAAINFLGVLARTSRAVFTLFVTRVSGPQVFGLFTLAAAAADLVTRLSVFGMDKSLLTFIPSARTNGRDAQYAILSAALRIALVLGALSTFLLVLSAPWIAERWLGKPRLGFPLQLIALSVLPLTLGQLALAATKALKIMSYDALVTGIVLPVSLLFFAVPILWVKDATTMLALAYTLAAVTAAVVAVTLFRRHFSVGQSLVTPARSALRRLAGFSTPLGLHDFTQYLTLKLEIFILAFFVTPTDLGIYALAAELALVMRKIRQVFDPILIPVISEHHSREQLRRVEANIARVMRWILMFGALYVAGVVLFARPMLSIFGADFTRGASVLVLLCVAHAVNANTGLLDTAMMVSGRPRINLLNVCILLVLQTGLMLWLVPRHGIWGAAVGVLVSLVAVGLIRIVQSFWILQLNPFAWTQLKPIGAAAVAVVATLALRAAFDPADVSLLWVGLSLVFVVSYVLVLRLLGLEDEDRHVMERVRRRVSRRP